EVQLDQFLDTLGPLGFRPISIEASTRWNPTEVGFERQYAVVLVRDAVGLQSDWDFSIELESEQDLLDDIEDKRNVGYVPFYLSTGHTVPTIELSETRYNVLYAKRPPSVLDGKTWTWRSGPREAHNHWHSTTTRCAPRAITS